MGNGIVMYRYRIGGEKLRGAKGTDLVALIGVATERRSKGSPGGRRRRGRHSKAYGMGSRSLGQVSEAIGKCENPKSVAKRGRGAMRGQRDIESAD
jgi:hypothetical protein